MPSAGDRHVVAAQSGLLHHLGFFWWRYSESGSPLDGCRGPPNCFESGASLGRCGGHARGQPHSRGEIKVRGLPACRGEPLLHWGTVPQSLQDEDLKTLGRDHSSSEALQTVEEAKRLCPGRVSLDVMFGRPAQSIASWESELRELLRVCDDHVSLYQLTVERGTQLFKQVLRGEVAVPAEDVTAEMYRCARRTLRQHGFLQYEVSNFARNKAVSHHNTSYWKGRQYIGVGPGAHGRFAPLGEGGVVREARTQTLEPDVWIREVQQRGHGTRRRIQLGRLELLEEVLVMGMRMTGGIRHKHWAMFSPQLGLREAFGSSSEVQRLLLNGQLILDDRGLRCSWDGLAVLDSMLPALLVELERQSGQSPKSRPR
ncbi:radical S-adenosyl methionine domain-containing protein 1, mitochondrial isoform 4-T7 [Spinachia spinachia]